MNCIPCQKKKETVQTQAGHGSCEQPQPACEVLCYGEGQITTRDECDTKLTFRLITDPNKEILDVRIQEVQATLLTWLQKPSAVTEQDMQCLNIFCFNSSLVGFENTNSTGVWVGETAAAEFLRLFNAFKTRFSYITPEVSVRLIAPDVLNANFVFVATAAAGPVSPTNPAIGRFVLSGQFHVIDFGNELCIDSVTVSASYPVVA